ncbi:hypothetical protein CRE_23756 [Caenorhabditis remanei]|uniref:Transmembrane protein n=1 Tax=Caenorhabditis remanei TaxID=31234 RepID=E3NHS0_CAERE|nr:hypothetical protein CRE_23756 [Caenorhabditis remanei]
MWDVVWPVVQNLTEELSRMPRYIASKWTVSTPLAFPYFIKEVLENEALFPLYSFIVYTFLLFSITEIVRRIGDRFLDESMMWKFNELISMTTMCACLNPQVLIFDKYGPFSMLIAVALHRKLAEFLNRGAGLHSSLLIEEKVQRTRITDEDFIWLSVAHVLSASFAFVYAGGIWNLTFWLTGLGAVAPRACLFTEKISMEAVGGMQFGLSFLIRVVLHYLATPELKKYHVLVYAVFIVGGYFLTGMIGIDAMVAVSTVLGCTHMGNHTPSKGILTYLMSLNSGWMLAGWLMGDTPMRSIHRERVEKRLEEEEAARVAALPPAPPKFVGKGNRRRQVR